MVSGINHRANEVRAIATEALIVGHATGEVDSSCMLASWLDPDGLVVLQLDCVHAASVVAHALWRRHVVNCDVHPEHGLLVWV